MTNETPCQTCLARIAPALLGDLPEGDLAALRAHLEACPACAAEQERYRQTLSRLEMLRELDPPRAFDVSSQLPAMRPGGRFRPPAWAWAAGLATLVLLGGLASGRVWVRIDQGAWMAGIGTPPAATATPALQQELDRFYRILQADLDTRRQEDRRQRRDDVRAELAGFGQNLSREQQQQLEARLARLEGRFDQRLQSVQADLRNSTEIQLTGLYGLLKDERRGELRFLNERIGRLANRNEQRATQTDAILATLLDVSEQQLKP